MLIFCHAPLSGRLAALEQVQRFGTASVDLFFALSGLLICYRLLLEERTTGAISLWNFYVRRSFRIFPPAFFYLAVVGIFGGLRVVPMDWPAWGTAWVFLRNYFTCLVRDTPANRFTGHFWSLGIEEHFYLLLPLLLVTFPRRRKLVLTLLSVAAFVWFAVYVHITPVAERSIFWHRRTDLRIGSLVFPALLALLLAEPKWRDRFTRWLRPSRMMVVLALAFAGYLLQRHFALDNSVAEADVSQYLYVSSPRGGTANLFRDIFEPLCFPLLMLSTLLHAQTWVGRLLEWAPLRTVGRISYSVYLWQQMFWVTAYRGWPIAHLQSPATGALMVVAMATGSYYLLEKPMMQLGHRFTRPVAPRQRDVEAATSPVGVVA